MRVCYLLQHTVQSFLGPHKMNNWVRVWRPFPPCQPPNIISVICNLGHSWLADYLLDFLSEEGRGECKHQLWLHSLLHWPLRIINSITQETWAANWPAKQANQLAGLKEASWATRAFLSNPRETCNNSLMEMYAIWSPGGLRERGSVHSNEIWVMYLYHWS